MTGRALEQLRNPPAVLAGRLLPRGFGSRPETSSKQLKLQD